MSTITVWILLTISTGTYNGGTTTVVARFDNQTTCEATAAKMPTGVSKHFCIEAKGALP